MASACCSTHTPPIGHRPTVSLACSPRERRPPAKGNVRCSPPANPDVVSYWARAGFFREAADLFEVHGKVPKVKVAVESEVLLPVTPVRAAEDVHAVVSTIQQRASAILSSELGLDPKATMGFAMALSESCQNIVEHAGTGGWVAVQAYNWRRKLARRVVVIAVADAGVEFRHSLEPTPASAPAITTTRRASLRRQLYACT